MFLAWNEIKYSKLRYSLIIGVLFLIAYLVFFLTGLAYGLAQDYRMAIDKWDADGIILSEEANDNLNMSMIPRKTLDDVDAEDKALFGQIANVIQPENANSKDSKIDVSFFGIDNDSFLMPDLIEGTAFTKDNEAVADISLKEENDISLNETVKIAGSDEKIKIVGFTENARYTVSPVLYVSLNTYQQLRFETVDESENARFNAIVVRGKNHDLDNITYDKDTLELTEINSYINNLPGYNAQTLTFGFMIGFLIVIAAIVIGIFIYVLTMQKTTIFGVMKAQGISSFYIGVSVIFQTLILALIGVGASFLLTYLSSLVLPEAVPFQINWLFFGGISVAMVLFAVLGAFFSVRTVAKIDPLKAIG